MEKDIKKAVDNFIDKDSIESKRNENEKKIKKDFSIVERVDRILVTEDGRQLLREQY